MVSTSGLVSKHPYERKKTCGILWWSLRMVIHSQYVENILWSTASTEKFQGTLEMNSTLLHDCFNDWPI